MKLDQILKVTNKAVRPRSGWVARLRAMLATLSDQEKDDVIVQLVRELRPWLEPAPAAVGPLPPLVDALIRPAPPAVTPPISGVYFIQCADAVKIGHSKDVHQRFTNLAVGQSAPPSLVGFMPMAEWDALVELERQTHAAFEAYWIRGEWFRITAGDAAVYIQRQGGVVL